MLLCALCTSLAHAQPVLTKDNIGPLTGDHHFYAFGGIPDSIRNAWGANQVWDMWYCESAIAAGREFDVVAPTDYSLGWMYPGATHIWQGGPLDEYRYDSLTNAAWEIVGEHNGGINPNGFLHFSNPVSLFRFPCTLGDSWVDTAFGVVESTFGPPSDVWQQDSVAVVGWGRIIRPMPGADTLDSAMLIRRVSTRIYNHNGPGNAYTIRTETHEWYRPGIHAPYVIAQEQYMKDSLGGFQLMNAVTYLYKGSYNTLGLDGKFTSATGANIFPNPAKDRITIRLNPHINAASITMLDATGRIVRSIEAKEETTFSTADLPRGQYFVRIGSKGGSGVLKVVLE